MHAAPLTGGGFAAVWRVRLADGRDTVLKVAPPPGVRLLSYENDLLAAEASYVRLARAAGAPVPAVLHHGTDRRVLDADWLCLPDSSTAPRCPSCPPASMTRQPATTPVRPWPASTAAPATATATAATGCTVRPGGSRSPRSSTTCSPTPPGWNVPLPAPPDRVRDVVARQAPVLDIVDRPALLHVDLWDGNLLAAVDADATRLTGLVDGECHLYGDWLLDLVSPCLLGRIEDQPQHPFLRGYLAESGQPFVADDTVRRRLALYRRHLYLIMLIEIPSRGMTGRCAGTRRGLLNPVLRHQVTTLDGASTAT